MSSRGLLTAAELPRAARRTPSVCRSNANARIIRKTRAEKTLQSNPIQSERPLCKVRLLCSDKSRAGSAGSEAAKEPAGAHCAYSRCDRGAARRVERSDLTDAIGGEVFTQDSR